MIGTLLFSKKTKKFTGRFGHFNFVVTLSKNHHIFNKSRRKKMIGHFRKPLCMDFVLFHMQIKRYLKIQGKCSFNFLY